MNTGEDGRWADVAAEAQRLVRAGRWEEAEASARSIPVADGATTRDLQAKVIAFIALAAALLQAGQREKGAGLLAEAEALARRLGRGGNWEEACALFDIGQAWRDAGDSAEALRLWDASIEAVEAKDIARLLAVLYRESRAMGLWDRGHRVLGLLPRSHGGAKDQLPK
jgi:tetratricopeptide (TPR) repeat protein